MRTLVTILAMILAPAPQLLAQPAALSPEIVRLARIREKMADNSLRQPNYTCLETVDRSRQPSGGYSGLEDTLRLEVAMVGDKEMFAWPGSTEFQDTEIGKLVSTGMFGNGNFGIYARMLFFGRGPSFEYRGETSLAGRKMFRYDFRMPKLLSGYHVRTATHEAVVGFHGSLYAAADTEDVARLEIMADDLPPELGLIETGDRIDYARVRIGDGSFLLPVESNLHMSSPQGTDRNRTRFTNCRKFSGESSLVFDDGEFEEGSFSSPTSSKPRPVAVEVRLPAELSMQLQFTTAVSMNTGALGDAVEAKLVSDLRQGKQVLVPKGAIARGRIVRLDRLQTYYAVGVKFTDLEWPGGHAALKLKFDHLGLSVALNGSRTSAMRDDATGDLVVSKSVIRGFQDFPWFWTTLP